MAPYLEYEGAFRCLNVEGAALSLQRVGEGGAAELHPAEWCHILRRAVVEQLVLLLLVGEPALLPGPQRPPLLLQEAAQFGLIWRRNWRAGPPLVTEHLDSERWSQGRMD